MFTALAKLPRYAIAKALAGLRRSILNCETRRLDRLYGALPPRIVADALDASAQVKRLQDVVQGHCRAGTSIFEAHDRAAIKLDSAEYAFSSLIDELRGVMTKLPTDWTPQYACTLVATNALPRFEARAA